MLFKSFYMTHEGFCTFRSRACSYHTGSAGEYCSISSDADLSVTKSCNEEEEEPAQHSQRAKLPVQSSNNSFFVFRFELLRKKTRWWCCWWGLFQLQKTSPKNSWVISWVPPLIPTNQRLTNGFLHRPTDLQIIDPKFGNSVTRMLSRWSQNSKLLNLGEANRSEKIHGFLSTPKTQKVMLMKWTKKMSLYISFDPNPLNIFESVLVSLVHPNITSITSICSPFSGQRNIMPLTAKHSSGSCGKKRPLWSYPKTSKSWNHEAPNSTVTRGPGTLP